MKQTIGLCVTVSTANSKKSSKSFDKRQEKNVDVDLDSNRQRFNKSFIDTANTMSDLSYMLGIFTRSCDDKTNDPTDLGKRLLFREREKFQNDQNYQLHIRRDLDNRNYELNSQR